jgi:hypothetical protein
MVAAPHSAVEVLQGRRTENEKKYMETGQLVGLLILHDSIEYHLQNYLLV